MIGPGLALSQRGPMGVLSKFGRSSAPAFLFSAPENAFPLSVTVRSGGHCGQSRRRCLDCAASRKRWERLVGKGDRRTRRGKIYAGSFGKTRPKDPKAGKSGAAKPAAAPKAAAKPAAKPAAKRAAK